jgi:glycosyltransferase involved in cell wall biosynthesis
VERGTGSLEGVEVKIAIVSTAYPLRGGIAHYNALLGEALSKRHEVHTVTFKRQYPSFLFPGKTQEESGEGIHAAPAPQLVDSINPFNWISVGRMLRQRKFDLLIFKYWLPFFGPCFGTIARVAKRGTGTKVLYICDNVVPHEHRPFDAAFTRYAFRSVDHFIVQSRTVERQLNEFWPGASHRLAPHPVYDIFGAPMDKQEARRILGIRGTRVLLFFGYVRAYKGLQVLIRAIAALPGEMDLHLMVVGEFYDDEQKYRSLIRDLGLEDRVTINSDYVPNEMVGRYFSASDAVVLPYVSATQSGIAQIAYNFDKPVIATDVGGLAEVIIDGETGYIVPPEDASRLAAAIQKFYDDGREAAFAARVRDEKGKYSWDNMVASIEDLAQTPSPAQQTVQR